MCIRTTWTPSPYCWSGDHTLRTTASVHETLKKAMLFSVLDFFFFHQIVSSWFVLFSLCELYIPSSPLPRPPPPHTQKEDNLKNQCGLLILPPLSRIIGHDSPTPSLGTTATFPGMLPYFFHPALLLLGPLQWHCDVWTGILEKNLPTHPTLPNISFDLLYQLEM